MDFEQQGIALAKIEIGSGQKAVTLIKNTLISVTSDDQVESFLDSYLKHRIDQGEDEKEAKNYRSRVKAILKNWKESEKRSAVYDYQTRSVQLLAKFARELAKGKTSEETSESETEESAAESDTVSENLLSIGDISAQLDRLAQHLHHHGRFDQAERLIVIANEILEEQLEPATM
jgi:hypothetical protein